MISLFFFYFKGDEMKSRSCLKGIKIPKEKEELDSQDNRK